MARASSNIVKGVTFYVLLIAGGKSFSAISHHLSIDFNRLYRVGGSNCDVPFDPLNLLSFCYGGCYMPASLC